MVTLKMKQKLVLASILSISHPALAEGSYGAGLLYYLIPIVAVFVLGLFFLISTTIYSYSKNKTEWDSKRVLTATVYFLQAISFYLPFTFLIGVALNYFKKSEVKGTILESHFNWQIRTFWLALIFYIIAFIGLYFANAIGFFVIAGFFILVTIWLIYRIVKGWVRLNNGNEMDIKT